LVTTADKIIICLVKIEKPQRGLKHNYNFVLIYVFLYFMISFYFIVELFLLSYISLYVDIDMYILHRELKSNKTMYI